MPLPEQHDPMEAHHSAGRHTVSVALCTHNGARFLGEQIRSICQQSCIPDEIVLSDDASTDASIEIAMREVEKHAAAGTPALRVLRNTAPLGITANFEQAITACHGDLIVLCDQDDVWRHDRIAQAVSEFVRRPHLLLLHSDARLVDVSGDPLGATLFNSLAVRDSELALVHRGQSFRVLQRRNIVTGAATVLRRRLLGAALPFPPVWLHDEWLAIVASCFDGVDALEQPLIDYRQHGHNQVGAYRLPLRSAIRRAFGSRTAANVRRAAKAQALVDRMVALTADGQPIAHEKVELARGQLSHQSFRVNLPPSRWKRLAPVACELARGNYARFGPGLRVVIADLSQAV